ncbi:lipid A deacylase LpxR family protein [Noviherbaspirillum cavernae]|uniref:Lipid A deacylase LpxR family protein n=2 Tax=Noviherbaspirillum cavernae TaxID=2320862 RepID=A0A418X688_9BURK|nr:lipid A deacylase LpxR family protein [Noviherbaspirillum cavernae]
MEHGKLIHELGIDNDSLLFNRDDGFYTSGMFYTRRYAVQDSSKVTMFGWRIGQELYTASDIKLPPEKIGPPDHPYAAWLFGGIFKEIHRNDGSHSRLGLDFGCLGLCAGGEWTQDTLHAILNQPMPQGWSKQVRNEFGVVLHADVAPIRWTPIPSLDITPSMKGRFGNIYTDVAGDVTIRAGRLNILPYQPALHGFLRMEARAVAYNATLQGGYFSNGNPYTVEPKRAVGEIEAGMAWIGASYALKASIVRRSNEIRDLSNSIGAQNFVRLQIVYMP